MISKPRWSFIPWPSLSEGYQRALRRPLERCRDVAVRELRFDDHRWCHEAFAVLVLRLYPILHTDIGRKGLPRQSLARSHRPVFAHCRNEVEEIRSASVDKEVLLRSRIHASELLLGVIGGELFLIIHCSGNDSAAALATLATSGTILGHLSL